MVNQMGLGPLGDRMGLFIAVTSYNGTMTFSATSCRRTLPDVELFMNFLRQSFEELLSLALKANKAASDKPTKKISKKKATKKTTSKKLLSKKNPVSKKKLGKKKVSKKNSKRVAKKATQKTTKKKA